MPQERIRALSPEKRVRTFEEVHLGLTKGEAIENAKIFLERERSVKGAGCPLGTDYFSVLRFVAKGDLASAHAELLKTNPFPGITGRLAVEPYEITQVYNRKGERISLRAIERLLADTSKSSKMAELPSKEKAKVAVVGSGPTGLAAAWFLVRAGFSVTVFDSSHVLGGSLSYAWGEFHLPAKVVSSVLARLRRAGVQFKANVIVGRFMTVDQLAGDGGFSAVLLATGIGPVRPLGIVGETAAGVFAVDEAMKLHRWMRAGQGAYTTPPFLGPRVIIVGGGAMAFEAARMAVRLGKSVSMVIAGPESSMEVPAHIVREASEEGVQFKTYAHPVKVAVDGKGCVKGLVCNHLDYRVDADGHLNIVEEDDSEFLIEAETIINASGHTSGTLFLQDVKGLELNTEGSVVVREGTSLTAFRKVFAAGHVVDPAASFMDVVIAGQKAAGDIEKFLQL